MPVSERTIVRVSAGCGATALALSITLIVARLREAPTLSQFELFTLLWVQVAAALLAVGLMCAAYSRTHSAAKIAAMTIGIAVLAVAVPSAFARLTQSSFDLRQLERFLRGARAEGADPNFLNPTAPAVLAVLSGALILIGTRRARALLGGLAVIIIAFGMLNVLSVLYGGATDATVGWRVSSLVGAYATSFGIGVVLLAGSTTWPFSAFAGSSVRAVMLRWLTPFTLFVVLGTDILTIRVFPRFSSALGSIANALASVIIAVVMASALSRVIGDRIERVQEALRDAMQRLQVFSRRALTAQEEERRNLSRELHDEFGQLLATIAVQIHASKSVAGAQAQPRLDECVVLLQRAGAEVRNLALGLRPVMLDTAGLDATLRWLAVQYEQRMGIPVEVAGHANVVGGDCAIVLFRVAQEALTNTSKYASARHVWIELSHSERDVELVVRDDGVGFDVTRTLMQATQANRLGLLGMRERVQLADGTLDVDSKPGRGTSIRVSLRSEAPLTPA